MSEIEEVRKRRAARKEALRIEEEAQREIDEESLDNLEIEYGDNMIGVQQVKYVSGQATMVIVRGPSSPETQRYRATVAKAQNVKAHDAARKASIVSKALDDLAASCVLYPDKELFELMCDQRPGLKHLVGNKAIGVALSENEELGN